MVQLCDPLSSLCAAKQTLSISHERQNGKINPAFSGYSIAHETFSSRKKGLHCPKTRSCFLSEQGCWSHDQSVLWGSGPDEQLTGDYTARGAKAGSGHKGMPGGGR